MAGGADSILDWEDIDDYHKRAKIFGGWLIKAFEDRHVSLHEDMQPQQGYEWQVSMCFVSDPDHKWTINATQALSNAS